MKALPPLRLPRALAGVIALVAMTSAAPAAAVRLGELKVHSTLGEALDASIALKTVAGEAIGPECFRLGSARSTRLLLDSQATFAIEPADPGPRLRIRTGAPIGEPVLLVRISAACPGGRASTRDYEILLDPRLAIARAVADVPAAAIAPPRTTSPAPSGTPGFGTSAGDTLASIARAIYPRDPAAGEAYVQALRNGNAALAGLGADEPIPAGTVIVLPDLREFSRSLARSTTAPAPRKAETPAPEKKPVPARSPSPPAGSSVAPRSSPPTTRAPTGAPFALRLSSPELDLGRSKGVDERQRALLRERMLTLDADDKVAALLALKHSVRQLESRVAELQLKLSTLPAAPATTTPAPKAAEPVKPAVPAPVPPASPAPKTTEPPAAPVAAAPAPKTAEPDKPAPKVAAPLPSAPKAPALPEPGMLEAIPPWLWGLLAALATLAGVLAWLKLRRRPSPRPAAPVAPAPVSALEEAEALMRGEERVEPMLLRSDDGRAVADTDAGLATRVGGTDPAMLRRRYIEERFPEIAGGTIALDDPDSVVKAARLFYEDGALPRAVELLQFAVEEQPASMKPWLALFEIFRLEGLTGEFGSLAARFREHHGASDNWQKVQFIGRELDPQNPLYHDAPLAHLETIGPLAAARLTPVTFDPLAENWLNAPMDFTSDALASTLRAALLADAGVQEADLAPDPMPALKNIEMFHVA